MANRQGEKDEARNLLILSRWDSNALSEPPAGMPLLHSKGRLGRSFGECV